MRGIRGIGPRKLTLAIVPTHMNNHAWTDADLDVFHAVAADLKLADARVNQERHFLVTLETRNLLTADVGATAFAEAAARRGVYTYQLEIF